MDVSAGSGFTAAWLVHIAVAERAEQQWAIAEQQWVTDCVNGMTAMLRLTPGEPFVVIERDGWHTLCRAPPECGQGASTDLLRTGSAISG
jgi:hypothetical protein